MFDITSDITSPISYNGAALTRADSARLIWMISRGLQSLQPASAITSAPDQINGNETIAVDVAYHVEAIGDIVQCSIEKDFGLVAVAQLDITTTNLSGTHIFNIPVTGTHESKSDWLIAIYQYDENWSSRPDSARAYKNDIYYVSPGDDVIGPAIIAAANSSIEANRKRLLTVHVQDQNGAAIPGDAVTVKQLKKEFLFGSDAEDWTRDATYESAWDSMRFGLGGVDTIHVGNVEETEGVYDYSLPNNTYNWLRNRGLKTSLHALFWSVDINEVLPSWLKEKSGAVLKTIMWNRVAGLGAQFPDADIIDVLNETVHYDATDNFYVTATGDSTIEKQMFDHARTAWPTAVLRINDFHILYSPDITEGTSTQFKDAYKTRIQELLAAGADIDAIGMQFHLRTGGQLFTKPEQVKSILDEFATAFPAQRIHITEFDYNHRDVTVRTEQIDAVMRVMYAHPQVDVINLWGFMEDHVWQENNNLELIDGLGVTNATGQKWQALMSGWDTDNAGNSDASGDYAALAFKGELEIAVDHSGVITTQTMTLGDSDETVTVAVVASESAIPGYQQDAGAQGLLAIEAEHYDSLFTATDGHEWQPVSVSGQSGSGAMQALPNNFANQSPGNNSPRMDYGVVFAHAGLHYFWVRGQADAASSDSVHMTLDDNTSPMVTASGFSSPVNTWLWKLAGTLTVDAVGARNVNIWMREAGMVVDKLVITTDAAYTPSGTGPVESVLVT